MGREQGEGGRSRGDSGPISCDVVERAQVLLETHLPVAITTVIEDAGRQRSWSTKRTQALLDSDQCTRDHQWTGRSDAEW